MSVQSEIPALTPLYRSDQSLRGSAKLQPARVVPGQEQLTLRSPGVGDRPDRRQSNWRPHQLLLADPDRMEGRVEQHAVAEREHAPVALVLDVVEIDRAPRPHRRER